MTARNIKKFSSNTNSKQFDGGPSTDNQDEKNWALDRAHHELTLVEDIHPW